ncbi:LOW QUALITY PROTEIN: melanoma inhibitory activity protein 2-like, partial [Phodopus roborovskii]|uniref:LOW QUALITY PROTEIN: melanoma inhibitory activity protein 2-like n=1 Tax=Phodopus roborovskii TaxID=109678 RepID=UPI0021E3B4A1
MFCEFKVVAAVPEDMTTSFDPSEPSLESLICVVAIGLLTIFLFLWRGYRSIQSRLYLSKENRLAVELAMEIKKKCDLIDKVCLAQEEYEGLESSLKEANFDKASTEVQSLKYKNLERDKSKLEEEILLIEKKLEEERSKHHEEEELMSDLSKMIQSLADESQSVKSQLAEAKTTLRIFEINKERLKGVITDTLNENSQRQESVRQYLEEAKVMKEQMNQLNKQKIAIEVSNVQAEQLLKVKENQIKSLMESLLRMKDWNSVLGEDVTDDGNLDVEVNNDLENNPIFLHYNNTALKFHNKRGTIVRYSNQPKGALRKLIYATELSASLKTLEGDRNQIYTQLSEIDATNDDLTEHMRSLKSEQVSLQSGNTQLEIEKQKLQRKITVMRELYQDNERMLHRKITVEENCRLEKEEELFKVNKRTNHVNKELDTYRRRAKDIEEELERTICSYQVQVMAHEQREHDYWLEARALERNVNELKRKNALMKATFPNSGPAKCKVAVHGLTPPLVAKVSGPRDHGHPAIPQNPRGQKPPPLPADARQYVPSKGCAGPRFPPKSDGPVPSTLESGKHATKHDTGKETLPTTRPPENNAAGHGLTPPPVPSLRGPRGSRGPRGPASQYDRRGRIPPPPPPGNICRGPGQYVPQKKFAGPQFPPMS